ncbi:hypothetical protein SAMN06265795_110105 [Noviherbaspirillum humi]|uniref:Uncharacterized protein n=1 Tax=Noviherbaspirillum humi TaxID=1688639 RepID=A0A239ISX4_9BURK|nr:hypothetical protein [Noviherbaspirillum humi]SNS96645.1 hypothetical protein SAMN06265795_110105 [Noviherbaspirillum humi]
MAWETFEWNGIKGVSGDIPIDLFATTLKQIADAYEERFSRKPTKAEIMYALEAVLAPLPARYISDFENPIPESLNKDSSDEQGRLLDTDRYEGIYTDVSIPGYHAVMERRSDGGVNVVEAIRVITLEVRDSILICDYEINKNLTDEDARLLITTALLQKFYANDYKNEAASIRFSNKQTGRQCTWAYD